MTPVTLKNAHIGLKVVRGPDWDYGNQDHGSIYGIVERGHGTDALWVSWRSREDPSVILRQNSYKFKGASDLAVYDAYAVKGKKYDDVCQCAEDDSIEVWNSAIEHSIDTIVDYYRGHNMPLDNKDVLICALSALKKEKSNKEAVKEKENVLF